MGAKDSAMVWIDGVKFARRNSRSEIIVQAVTKKSSGRVIASARQLRGTFTTNKKPTRN